MKLQLYIQIVWFRSHEIYYVRGDSSSYYVLGAVVIVEIISRVLVGHQLNKSFMHFRIHRMRLVEWPSGRNLNIFRFGFLYNSNSNLLLPDIVLHRILKEFQRALSGIVRDRVVAGDDRWRVLLSLGHVLFQHRL